MFFRKPDRSVLLEIWMQIRGNHQAVCNNLSRMEKVLMTMMEDVKKEVAELKDVVPAVVSALDALKKAVDYLHDHPVVKEDPALADVAKDLAGVHDALAAEVAKVAASGSVG